MNRKLPVVTGIEPGLSEIRDGVRLMKQGEIDGPITATLEYTPSDAQKRRVQVTFGYYAIFPNGDLAFTRPASHTRNETHGILLVNGESVRISIGDYKY